MALGGIYDAEREVYCSSECAECNNDANCRLRETTPAAVPRPSLNRPSSSTRVVPLPPCVLTASIGMSCVRMNVRASLHILYPYWLTARDLQSPCAGVRAAQDTSTFHPQRLGNARESFGRVYRKVVWREHSKDGLNHRNILTDTPDTRRCPASCRFALGSLHRFLSYTASQSRVLSRFSARSKTLPSYPQHMR